MIDCYTYKFPDEHDILTAHDIQPERHVTVLLAHKYPLNSMLKHEIGKLVD